MAPRKNTKKTEGGEAPQPQRKSSRKTTVAKTQETTTRAQAPSTRRSVKKAPTQKKNDAAPQEGRSTIRITSQHRSRSLSVDKLKDIDESDQNDAVPGPSTTQNLSSHPSAPPPPIAQAPPPMPPLLPSDPFGRERPPDGNAFSILSRRVDHLQDVLRTHIRTLREMHTSLTRSLDGGVEMERELNEMARTLQAWGDVSSSSGGFSIHVGSSLDSSDHSHDGAQSNVQRHPGHSRRQSAASIANLLNPVEEPGLPSMATPMPSPTVFAQGPGVAAESFSGEPHHQRCLLTAPARPRSALPPPGQGRLSPAWVAPPRSLSANPDAFGMQPGSSSSMKRAREDDHGGDERNPKHSRGPREGLAGGTNRIPSMPPTLDAYNVIRASRRLPTPAYTTASSNQSGAPSRSSSRGGVQMPVPVHPASTQYQHLATHDASLPSRSTPLRDIPELEPPDNEPSSYDRRASPLLVRAPLARSPLDSHKEAEDFTSDGEEVEAELNCGS